MASRTSAFRSVEANSTSGDRRTAERRDGAGGQRAPLGHEASGHRAARRRPHRLSAVDRALRPGDATSSRFRTRSSRRYRQRAGAGAARPEGPGGRRSTDNPRHTNCTSRAGTTGISAPQRGPRGHPVLPAGHRAGPSVALALCGLADCYGILRVYGWTPAAENKAQAEAAVTEAMALTPTSPRRTSRRPSTLFYFERRWRDAGPHFLGRARELNPRSPLRSESTSGLFHSIEGDALEMRPRMEAPRSLLDPLSPFSQALLRPWGIYIIGDFDEAERLSGRGLSLQGDYLLAFWSHGLALVGARPPGTRGSLTWSGRPRCRVRPSSSACSGSASGWRGGAGRTQRRRSPSSTIAPRAASTCSLSRGWAFAWGLGDLGRGTGES